MNVGGGRGPRRLKSECWIPDAESLDASVRYPGGQACSGLVVEGLTVPQSSCFGLRCCRNSCSCRELVFRLPGWPDRSTHRAQEGIDILVAECSCRVAENVLAVVPLD
jgi:hypothetical protein